MASGDDVLAQIRRANERFYRAFESLEMAQMEAIWVQAERAKCIHPGWDILVGWETIRKSWQAIFASTDYIRFVITDVSVHVYNRVAWVTCVENLSDDPAILDMMRILTTNVYEYNGTDWCIVHHHASPIMRHIPASGEQSQETLN